MKTVKEVTERFIRDGWNKNIILKELTEEEVIKNGLNTGKQYFQMQSSGNIYHANGVIAVFGAN